MKRTELKRTTPLRAKAPPKDPKRRQRKCAVLSCRTPFEPRSMTHKACKPECAAAHVEAEKARKLKRERQEGLQKLKRKADYIKDAQVAFNAFIRARDEGKPCICCGRMTDKESRGGVWDAGHYRSRGSAPHLRFNEDNVHAQLKQCNRFDAGRAVDYRVGLIARIGLARVEALEANNVPHHWTVDELKAIKTLYQRKLKDLKNGAT